VCVCVCVCVWVCVCVYATTDGRHAQIGASAWLINTLLLENTLLLSLHPTCFSHWGSLKLSPSPPSLNTLTMVRAPSMELESLVCKTLAMVLLTGGAHASECITLD
jgi:hypothetical protein